MGESSKQGECVVFMGNGYEPTTS